MMMMYPFVCFETQCLRIWQSCTIGLLECPSNCFWMRKILSKHLVNKSLRPSLFTIAIHDFHLIFINRSIDLKVIVLKLFFRTMVSPVQYCYWFCDGRWETKGLTISDGSCVWMVVLESEFRGRKFR
jgi:hypothetical protein